MPSRPRHRSTRSLGLVLVLAPLVAPLTACGDDSSSDETTLVVYAASSLTSTFTTLAKQFEADHDDVEVKVEFGGSSDLEAQIDQGAPADVFASADTATMDKLVEAGLTGSDPVPFASNTLEIAVPPDNPAGITTLADLAGPDVKPVLCAPEVPCGAVAAAVAEAAGLTFTPVSEEQKVTDVLGKVESGEADAGLVYVTDVIGAGDKVEGITFPESDAAVTTYPIASIADSKQADLAQQFVDLVTSTDGRAVLHDAGFAQP